MSEEISCTVDGMSCRHCVDHITEEVSRIDGVSAVTVDPAANEVTVLGSGVRDDEVRAAIGEAGYQVASAA